LNTSFGGALVNREASEPNVSSGTEDFIFKTLEAAGDVANPFEALDWVFDGEGAWGGLVFCLLFLIGFVAISFLLAGIWSGVQEAFFSGGPQGLGLK
jgi:hypothetical protein